MVLNINPHPTSKDLAATLDSLKEAFNKNDLPPSLQGKDVMADLDNLPKTDSIDFSLDSPHPKTRHRTKNSQQLALEKIRKIHE
ncbi:hypothetical protein SUGI_1048490 [Cryptomeria japonica]|nr:hypothetical protein SUGI_1048490 [Cryptomeria japonica]